MTEIAAIDPGIEKTPLHLLPPERAARRLLLRQVKQAESAGQRLAIGDDPRALHDFRVALRRFRALERAYRPWLGEALPKKLRRRLRDLVRSTGPARDSEVQLEWLAGQGAAPRPAERPGYQWLRRQLEDRQRRGYAAIRGAAPIEFASLATLLRAGLTLPSPSSATSLAAVAGSQLAPLAAQLGADFDAIAADGEMRQVHEARLLVKRARYVLEPVAAALPQGKELSRELGELQELLGGLHDAEVLGDTLGEAAAEAGAARYRELVAAALDEDAPVPRRRGDERAGLGALARRVQAQMREGSAGLQQRLRGGDIAALLRRLAGAAEALAASAPAPDVPAAMLPR
jgi:CHAD domain-containing protein